LNLVFFAEVGWSTSKRVEVGWSWYSFWS